MAILLLHARWYGLTHCCFKSYSPVICHRRTYLHRLCFGRNQGIPRPTASDSTHVLEEQWTRILGINWYPIFNIALTMLNHVDRVSSSNALRILKSAASELVTNRAVRDHDIVWQNIPSIAQRSEISRDKLHIITSCFIAYGVGF